MRRNVNLLIIFPPGYTNLVHSYILSQTENLQISNEKAKIPRKTDITAEKLNLARYGNYTQIWDGALRLSVLVLVKWPSQSHLPVSCLEKLPLLLAQI